MDRSNPLDIPVAADDALLTGSPPVEAYAEDGGAQQPDDPKKGNVDLRIPRPKKQGGVPPTPVQQPSTFVASKRDPARWAKVLDLSKRLGLPDASFVDRNFDALSSADDQHRAVAEGSNVSPTLAVWLSNPDNATLAKHETPALGRVDAGAKLVAEPAKPDDGGFLSDIGTATATGVSDLASSAGHLAVAFGLTSPAKAAAFVADMNTRSASLRAQAPDYAKEFSTAMQEHAGALDKAVASFQAKQAQARRSGIFDALMKFTGALTKGIPAPTHVPADKATIGETLALIGAAASRPKGLAYQGVEGLASMAPMMSGAFAGGLTGGVVGSVVPGVGTAVGATVGSMAGTFAGMAPVNVGSEINRELTKRGVDITDAGAVERAFSDPALMAAIRAKASRAGITNAAVVALTSGLAGHLLAGATKAGAGLAGKTVAAAGDVAVQAAGMGAASAAGQAASGEPVSPGEAMSTALSMLAVGGGMEAIGASRRGLFHADPIEAAAQVASTSDNALRAVRDAQALSEIGKAVQASTTTASVPDRIKSLIETATGGEAAAHVYFQTDEFNRHFEAQGVSPAKAAADIMGDEGKAYHDAITTGGRLAIPIADYIAKVAPTEHWDGLLNVARTTPDGMTLSEAHDHLQALPSTMQAIADEAMQQPEQAGPDGAVAVGQHIESQLLGAGVGPVAARTQAALYESTFRTLGLRMGQDPKALFDTFNVQVKRGRAFDAMRQAAEAATAAEKARADAKAAEITAQEEADAAMQADKPLADGEAVTAPIARPRTESGTLKNLTKATEDELANEYRILVDANATENTAPTTLENTNSGVEQYVGMKDGAIKAAGRIAARAKTIAKLEAEMATRGMDPVDAYQRGDQNRRMSADALDFPFGDNQFNQSAFTPGLKYPGTPEGQTQRQLDDFIKRSAEHIAKTKEKAAAGQIYDQPVYHGSPHIFDRFSLHAIGSGEGAQAYGWGLYFAGSKAVAEYYRRALSDGSSHAEFTVNGERLKAGTPEKHAASLIAFNDVREIRATTKRWVAEAKSGDLGLADTARLAGLSAEEYWTRVADFAAAHGKRDIKVQRGRLYHVEIPEDDTMLHWDKPFSEQPPAVQKALADMGVAPLDPGELKAVEKRLDAKLAQMEAGKSSQTWAKERQYIEDTQNLKDPKVQQAWIRARNGESEAMALEGEVRALEGQARQIHAATSATGESVYRQLSRNLGKKGEGDRLASEALSAAGLSGIKYLDGSSRGAGEGSHNYVIFDENLVKIADYEQRANGGAPRGRIRIAPDATAVIDLFEKADRSTFLHETGHLYFHVLDTLAGDASAPDELKADRATIRSWLGADSESPLTRDQHETFARGFEAYLMEGKAPSVALRSAFQRFKSWLVDIYQHVSKLDVTLSPDVRAVFDRLIASREAIAEAEQTAQVNPLFEDPKAVGMTEAQAAHYASAAQAAHDTAEETLTTAMMKEIRREESAEWKAWRDPIKAEVTAQVEAEPVYRAFDLVGRGSQPDGTPKLRLDRDAVAEIAPDHATLLSRKGLTSTTDGLHPDVAAELLGFDSGAELLTAMATAPTKATAIRAATEARMQAEHGQRMTDADVAGKASEAVRGEKRSELIQMELDHLSSARYPTSKSMRARALIAAAREHAAAIIARQSIRDIRPDTYERAAARHAKDAQRALLGGDHQAAFTAKQKELLLTELSRAATDARSEISAALDTFKKVFRSDTRLADSRDMNLVNAARSVLATFGIGRSDKPASEYLAQIRAYDPESADVMQAMVDEAIATGGTAKDYKAMTLGQFRAMEDAVTGMWNLARTTRQITIDGVVMDRHTVQAEIVARVGELTGTGPAPGTHERLGKLDALKTGLLSLQAASTKVEHWVRMMDGGANDGPLRRFLFNRIREATTAFRARKAEETSAYESSLREREAAGGMPLSRAKIAAPELSYTFAGHNELLGALLHTGNESNLAKNLVGRGWADVREDGSVDTSRWDGFLARMRKEGTLTKAHYDWAQDVWDRMEALKPDAQRAHKAMYGRYFAEITATPFTNEYGDYAGGYFPAKADPSIVPDAQARADRDTLLGENTSFLFPPSVGKGFTIRRVEGYRKPLVMDASAVPQHLDAVLRFTHIGPAVREVGRVVTSHEVRDALHQYDPSVVPDALVPWLQRAAQQRGDTSPSGTAFWRNANRAAAALRNNAALQIMAANTTVLLEQLTHFPSVLVRVAPDRLASAAWSYLTNHGEVTRMITESSPFMATRESATLDAARTSLNRILLDPTLVERVSDWSREHGRFLMAGIASVMDHTVWAATYDEAMQTMTHDEAVRHADATVRELLGSYAPEDISAIEGGTPVQRLFTMFYGFFNTKANVLKTELSIAQQTGFAENRGRVAAALLWGFMVPSIMGLGIKNAMQGKGVLAQQDDEGTLHALLAFMGEGSLEMGARMIPYGGTALVAAEKAFHVGRGPDMLNSPAVKMAQDALTAPGHLAQGLLAHDVTGKQITDLFTLIGMATGFPARPIGKALGYMQDVHTGRSESTGPGDYARGLTVGH